MSSVLEQFIAESRDLIETAGDLLLELERNTQDAPRLDALFRAVHTIKGNSGLFDLPAFTPLVHVLEDRLDDVRQLKSPLGRELIDTSLEALDHLSRMIDEVEARGTTSTDAAALSTSLLARLRNGGALADVHADMHADAPGTVPQADDAHDADPSVADAWHLVYRPKADAFFCGEDPLYLVQSLPGLAHVEIECADAQPLDEHYDVFQANATYSAICYAPRDALDECFRYVPEEVRMQRAVAPTLDAAERQNLALLLRSQREVVQCAQAGSGAH